MRGSPFSLQGIGLSLVAFAMTQLGPFSSKTASSVEARAYLLGGGLMAAILLFVYLLTALGRRYRWSLQQVLFFYFLQFMVLLLATLWLPGPSRPAMPMGLGIMVYATIFAIVTAILGMRK